MSATVLPEFELDDNTLRLRGRWTVDLLESVDKRLRRPIAVPADALVIDLSGVEQLDAGGAWLVQRLVSDLKETGKAVEIKSANPESAAILSLIAKQSDPRGCSGRREPPPFLETLGRRSVQTLHTAYEFLSFVGESALTSLHAIPIPRRLRPRMILKTIEQAGVAALPIVGLLSFLIGVVISYQSAVFLRQYGANYFLANLVGISMARELAPLLTAIIVAGRTGSAFTAQIGTMMVTEEIDALRTMGIRPIEILVLPKVLGLIIALPLLTLFADILGIFGGALIGKLVLGINLSSFLEQLAQALNVSSYLVGLAKAPIFALVIATVGCYQGFKVQGSAESVGLRTTQSVVQSIFIVIVADAALSILFNWLGI